VEKSAKKLINYLPNIKQDTDYYAIIVEPRILIELEPIIKNVMYHLNECNSNIKWGLQIFHGTTNKTLVKKFTKDWGEVIYEDLGKPDLTKKEYNDMLKSPQFWHKTKGKKVLIFQSDSIMLRSGIDEFLEFDYIGAPWIKPKENSNVGNGGFSLRNKELMIEITSKFENEEILMEDIYFAKYLDKQKIANIKTAKKFCVEDIFYPTPLAVHNPIKIPEEKLKIIFNI
jgi:hypothetical protein